MVAFVDAFWPHVSWHSCMMKKAMSLSTVDWCELSYDVLCLRGIWNCPWMQALAHTDLFMTFFTKIEASRRHATAWQGVRSVDLCTNGICKQVSHCLTVTDALFRRVAWVLWDTWTIPHIHTIPFDCNLVHVFFSPTDSPSKGLIAAGMWSEQNFTAHALPQRWDWCPAMPFRLQPGSTSLDLGEESEEDSVLLDLDRYWISGICSLADGFADAVQFAHFGVVFHHVATWQRIHTAIEVTYLAWKMLSVPIHCKSCKWQTDSQCKENDNPPRKARKTLKEDEEDAKPGMSSLVRIHHDMLY